MIDNNIESILASLRNMLPADILLVGMGNSLKADDGIGPEICSQLKETIPDNVIDTGTVPENYIQVIIKKAPKAILFIDAIDFGAPPGTINIFDSCQLSAVGITTHTLSPRLLSNMITQSIPAKIYFIGIQPKSMTIGHPMSQEVKSAKKELVVLFKHMFSLNNTV
ncbi:MAG: hydrogenase 3 maturation endopeptidase HyCI [Deltaproteobacteria bacterium]|nr:hydrogenase 3 maturation endopeptidase HyCI [Deltaproteobacteria bacterium]